MLNKERLRLIQNKFQTTEDNVLREYAQNLFLSSLYQMRGSQHLLFKGGTALRLAYKSPRFSQDLDFSAGNISYFGVENIILDVLTDFGNQGIKFDIEEAKETTGGYLGKLSINIYERQVLTEIQISFREKEGKGCDTLDIVNEYIPTYVANLLPLETMVKEKIQAALTRSKPRDFYDIYFLLRQGLIPVRQRQSLLGLKDVLSKKEIEFKRELFIFLPRSMKPVAESFPELFLSEIEKFSV